MIDRIHTAALFLITFARVRFGMRFAARSDLLVWQQRRLRHFLSDTLPLFPYYTALKGKALSEMPLVDKSVMRENFERFNMHGISAAVAMDLALRSEKDRDFSRMLPHDISVGLSSGTSGQPSLFLTSSADRSIWAGAILARTLSKTALLRLINPFSRPLRVAFFLRANNALYTTVQSRRLCFAYFDLQNPFDDHIAELDTFLPDVLIAPASVLNALARAQLATSLAIAPAQVISVAEVLESDDEDCIAAAWHIRPSQIYQCTEGFLGASCKEGRLHLNEEFIHFEPKWIDESLTRFTPIITDFSRRTQAFVRYHLDDVLRPATSPCPCGRVSLSLLAIEGRRDDILWLPTLNGAGLQPLFGDSLRRVMALAQSRKSESNQFEDYRIEQFAMNWRIRLQGIEATERASAAVSDAIYTLCGANGLQPPSIRFDPWDASASTSKRRRIRCAAMPDLTKAATSTISLIEPSEQPCAF